MSTGDLLSKYPVTTEFIQTKFCMGTGSPEILTSILEKFLARRNTISGKILACIEEDENFVFVSSNEL
jgi:hypothetical protein